MSVKMKFGSKDIPFVYKGDKLVYPNPIKDGLLLWYDFKGMRNTDTNKEVAKDLSGNGNDGTLTNFNFTEESGYKDNTLVFDGVDDSLTIPELVLDETAMSVEIDGKTYAYDGDKVVSVDKDSSIIATNQNLYGDHISIEKDQTEGATTLVRNHSKAPFGFYTVGARGNVSFVQLNNIFPQAGIYTVSWEIEGNQNTAAQNAISTHEGVASDLFVNPSTSNEAKKFSYTFEVKDVSTQNWLRFDRLGWLWYYFKYIDVRMVSQPVEFSPNPSDLQKTTFAPSHLESMQIYNKPLNKTELLHNAESKGLKKLKPGVIVQDGLVLHYDFSHESNTSEYKGKAFDYSGNGNHGVLNNFNFTEESGYESKGLKFDSVDDFIETQDSEDFDITGNLTLEGTFYIPDDNEISIGGILVKGNYGSWANNAYGIRSVLSSGDFTQYRFFATDSNGEQSRVNISFQTGKVNYIVGVVDFDEGLITSYLNGEKLFSNPLITSHIKKTSDSIFVGEAYGHNSLLKGNIYSTRVYNRALTPEEIQHNYQIEKEKFNITEGDV